MRVLIIDPLATSDSASRKHVSKLEQTLTEWHFDDQADLAVDMLDVEAHVDAFHYNVVLVCDSEETKAFIKKVRKHEEHAAIIVLSETSEIKHVVACLNWGADDYQVTPVAASELVARMKTIVLRHNGYDQHVVQCGPIRIDFNAHRWLVPEWKGQTLMDYAPCHLPPALWKILECLVLRAGDVCTREDLINHMYGVNGCEHDISVIDVFIYHLRKKFAKAGIPTKTIQSAHGRGYFINIHANGPDIAVHGRRGGRRKIRRAIEPGLEAAE